MNSHIEEFRPVVGYEAFYSVSNLGRVRRDGRRCYKNAGFAAHGSMLSTDESGLYNRAEAMDFIHER